MKNNFEFLLILILCIKYLYSEWYPDTRVTNDFAASYTSLNNTKSLAISGDTIHAVWVDERDGNPEIYYARSFDKGETWESPRRLTYNDSLSLYPAIAVKDSFVHIVWSDFRDGGAGEIYYKRSRDYGETFESERRITYAPLGSGWASVAVWNSTVHIVWDDARNYIDYQIYYTRSLDNGESFEPERQITTPTNLAQLGPSICVWDSIVHIVWYDLREFNTGYKIYYTRSLNNGESFEQDRKITYINSDIRYCSISCYDSLVGVVYVDLNTNTVYFSRSVNRGVSWTSPTLLGDMDEKEEWEPSISIYKNYIRAIWEEKHNNKFYLIYKYSENKGLHWKPETILVSADNSYGASIVDDGKKVCVLWTDTRDWNEEIYFKKNVYVNVMEKSLKNKTNIFLSSVYVRDGVIPLKIINSNKPLKIYLFNKYGKCVLNKKYFADVSCIFDKSLKIIPDEIYFLKVLVGRDEYKFKVFKLREE